MDSRKWASWFVCWNAPRGHPDSQVVRTMDDTAPPQTPRMWQVAPDVTYAEMPVGGSIRPPLLTPWESSRVQEMPAGPRRQRWLAERTLAKALLRAAGGRRGIIDIREGVLGQPLVYEHGMPAAGTWLATTRRGSRIGVAAGARPIGLSSRRPVDDDDLRAGGLISARELRTAKVLFRDVRIARALVWALKEAAVEALRRGDFQLAELELTDSLELRCGDAHLRPLAIRVRRDAVVCVVAPASADGPDGPLLIVDPEVEDHTASRVRDAFERSLLRARRILDARYRRLGWNPA